jgi:hypothetical protein
MINVVSAAFIVSKVTFKRFSAVLYESTPHQIISNRQCLFKKTRACYDLFGLILKKMTGPFSLF